MPNILIPIHGGLFGDVNLVELKKIQKSMTYRIDAKETLTCVRMRSMMKKGARIW